MPLSLDEKYEMIYAHEEEFTYALARRVVKKPEISVWMILLPILFVHHAYRVNQYKEGVKGFAKGIMSSKLKALDKSYREISSGETIEFETQDYFPDVELKTLSDKALAQKQEKVIRIMESHFRALLNASGETMDELLKNVYRSDREYRQYFEALMEAEKRLNLYLIEKVHTDEATAAVVREIESNCEALREEEVRYFFG